MATTFNSSGAIEHSQLALLNTEHSIQVRGARVHNLKNVDVNLSLIHI